MRRRAARRSCSLHGDNGCEIQGEAGPRTRTQEARQWTAEAHAEVVDLREEEWPIAFTAAHLFRVDRVGWT